MYQIHELTYYVKLFDKQMSFIFINKNLFSNSLFLFLLNVFHSFLIWISRQL